MIPSQLFDCCSLTWWAILLFLGNPTLARIWWGWVERPSPSAKTCSILLQFGQSIVLLGGWMQKMQNPCIRLATTALRHARPRRWASNIIFNYVESISWYHLTAFSSTPSILDISESMQLLRAVTSDLRGTIHLRLKCGASVTSKRTPQAWSYKVSVGGCKNNTYMNQSESF